MIKNCPKRGISFLLMVLFLMSISVININIDSSMAAASSPYKDVSSSHWALKHITKLDLRGVVTGYGDGVFKPDNLVTQVEAVLMVVRNMDAATRIASVDTSQTLSISVPEWALKQYKKELLFAVQEGLIVPSENNFNASAEASRAWITQLMVRMIDKDSEATLLANQSPNFGDCSDIPSWALGYVNAGVKYGLISGFPDNTFKPLQGVTRAQAVTMLSNSEPYLNLSANVMEGTILSISDSILSLSTGGLVHNFAMTSNTAIFGEDNSLTSIDDLKVNDRVKIIVQNSEVKYIAFIEETSSATKISGTVVHSMLNENLLVIKTTEGEIYTRNWSTSTQCVDQNGQAFSMGNLIVGSQVEIELNSEGLITRVVVYTSGGITGDSGIIYDIVPEQNLIVLKTASGSYVSYIYDSALAVIIDGIRFPTLDDLQIGDQVKVTADGSFISEIQLINAQQDLNLSGRIAVISPAKKVLVVDVDGELQTFTIASNTTITIPGVSAALLSDLEVDDEVDLKIVNAEISSITVTNRSLESSQAGTIVAIDTQNSIIIFEDADEKLTTYEVSSASDIVIDGDDDCDLSDLEKDMKAEFEVFNDKIIYLEVDTSIIGSVLTINPNRRIISIKTDDNDVEVYAIDSSADVNIADDSRADLEDIDVGDRVKLEIEDEAVTRIDVEASYYYEITQVYEDTNRLKVIDEDEDTCSLYLSSRVDLIIPGMKSPDVDDFAVGDIVKCTFTGSRLTQVEKVPVVNGVVTAISSYSGTVSIQSYDAQYYNYKFDSGCSVVDGSKTYTSVSALETGDRVRIQEASDGNTVFYLLEKISANFANSDLNEEKVYITQYSTSYTYYKLTDSCYIHRGSTELSLRQLQANDPIYLYLFNDLVYEIEAL